MIFMKFFREEIDLSQIDNAYPEHSCDGMCTKLQEEKAVLWYTTILSLANKGDMGGVEDIGMSICPFICLMFALCMFSWRNSSGY